MRVRSLCLILSVSALGAFPSLAQEGRIFVELEPGAGDAIALPSVAPLVERAGPACLMVSTQGRVSGPARALPPGHPRTPRGRGPPGIRRGEGAGFLIHPSGYALTNFHVIEGAEMIRVRVGTSLAEIDVEVVGTDPKSDVALLKLKSDRRDWPVIPLGDSDALRVGDFVVAIGNPFGLDQTVSMGILSARGRKEVQPGPRQGLYDFLQTDASINPGNSGGPLLNLRGEAVGINTAINAAAQGIGFAIPINMVKALLDDLAREGRVVRAWIGIGIHPVSAQLAKAYGLSQPTGALVRTVVAESPADTAGLQPGDVITHFDDRAIHKASELPLLAADAGIGRSVKLRLVREGATRSVTVKLAEHPDSAAADAVSTPAAAAPASPGSKAKKRGLGVNIVTLNDADRTRLDLPGTVSGARVVQVEPGSPAYEGGLLTDDVVLKANGRDVNSAQDLAMIVRATASDGVLRLLVLRRGATVFVAVIKP